MRFVRKRPSIRSTSTAKKSADQEPREEELSRRGDAAASMPAAQPMAGEELATTWPREGEYVFEVRKRSREGTSDRRIERSEDSAEKQDARRAGSDLESAVGDVLVGNPIARDVEEQPERKRPEPRVDERATDRTLATCRETTRTRP